MMSEEIISLTDKGHTKAAKKENVTPSSELSIRAFYDDAVVFVTGGTGFLGKTLIEKLLRTCTGIRAIYVHVRSKRGVNSTHRYKEFVRHAIFDRLRAENPMVLGKLACIAGDIIQPKLGLSDEDYEMVLKSVSIVFHSAATIKFNEPLKEAGNLNSYGTERLMEMCTKMTKLKSFVHVSTAYCNPGRKYIGEVVYPSSSPLDKDCFMKCVHILPDEVLNSVLDIIKGPHPNTYTLTKSIAELIVSEYSHKFPTAIVRPSIITSSISEPYPGWIDNVQGITGIMLEVGRGTISSISADSALVCDIIPVDVVVNTIIGAAWNSSINNDKQTQVFNCTSGQISPINWEDIGAHTMKWARIYPSKHVTLYPNFKYRKSIIMHTFYVFMLHTLPALFFDIILKFQGSKPIMMKIAKKISTSCDIGKFFAHREWIFDNDNQKRLVKEMQAAVDGNEFQCDISKINYDAYFKDYILGIRKFVLNDGEESLSKARSKLSKLYWFKIAVELTTAFLIFYLLGRILF